MREGRSEGRREPNESVPDQRWEGELYPFLAGRDASGADRDAGPDPATVLEEVVGSTRQKAADVAELRDRLWEREAEKLVRAARLLASVFASGGKALAFGNGGSATDARDLVEDLVRSPVSGGPDLPALDLTRDQGVMTAVANDVAFDSVFVRQIVAFGERGDVAVGFSTSGESENVLRAFRTARESGLATLGFAGFEGGRMAEDGFLDVCIVAPSGHVPRIQEAHATAYHALLSMTRALLAGGRAA